MSEKAEQEYYLDQKYVVIKFDVEGDNDLVVVADADGYGDYTVVNRERLVKKEDSYYYKAALKRADEIRMITVKAQENLEAVADKVVDKALKSLASRIKFNVAFGDTGSSGAYALMISTELEKMIKESGEKMKGKLDLDIEL